MSCDARTETRYAVREFLGPERLDSFRAYLEETVFEKEEKDSENYRMLGAGFYLAEEEGRGHFCFDHVSDAGDLEELLQASTTIIRGLTGLNEAIRAYLLERESKPATEGRTDG